MQTMCGEDNKSIVRHYFDLVWNQAQRQAIDTFCAACFIGHGSGQGAPRGLAGLKYLHARYLRTFPDLHVTIEDMIAEGDHVVARITIRGTYRSTLAHSAPSAERVTWSGIDIYRLAGSKIVEAWTERDRLGLLEQLTVPGPFRGVIAAAGSVTERASLLRYFLQLGTAHHGRGTAPDLQARRHEDITVQLQGATYVVGLASNELFTFAEIYHYRVYERVSDFVPRAGWTVLDLGANIGIFAIQQAQRGADVHAFEPNPDCYRRLTRNVAANGLANRVRAYNVALSAAPGLGELRVARGGTVSGTITPIVDRDTAPASAITMTPLDHIVPSLGVSHVDLLKIDVEGAEVAVLRGAAQTLPSVERIIVEYHAPELLVQTDELLRDAGFDTILQVETNPAIRGVGLLYVRKRT